MMREVHHGVMARTPVSNLDVTSNRERKVRSRWLDVFAKRQFAASSAPFQQVKNQKTPVMVERVVADIYETVRLVRFPGWQTTAAGEREVKKALRKSLVKYQLHQDAERFERAYGHIRQYC